MAVLAVVILVNAVTQAQQPNHITGVLSYTRRRNANLELVNMSVNTSTVRHFSQDICWSVSPNRRFLVESSSQRSNLIVRNLQTFAVVLEVPYQPEWETCWLAWQPDSSLHIKKRNSENNFYNFNLVGNKLLAREYVPVFPQYPKLPGWLKNTVDGYVLPSPNKNYYLYKRCQGITTPSSERSCPSITDYVIYGVNEQRIIHSLREPNFPLIEGRSTGQYYDALYDSYGAAAWSFSERYLAFAGISYSPLKLQVYDLMRDEYLPLEFVAVHIDWEKAMQWSPQGNKLALWVVGTLIPDFEVDERIHRTLVFFDADTNTFVAAHEGFDVNQGIEKLGLWSPDGSAFAFVTPNKILIDVDATSGEDSVLDTGVVDILAWKNEAN
jgi:hypothetical protein